MADHRKRFDRWRRLAPKPTRYLIEQVLDRIVPRFEQEGFIPGSLRPSFSVYLAALPPECRRLGLEVVAREFAFVVYAPVYFTLCKGRRRSLDCQFGYEWFWFRPERKPDAEVAEAWQLLPEIFRLFREGIPEEC